MTKYYFTRQVRKAAHGSIAFVFEVGPHNGPDLHDITLEAMLSFMMRRQSSRRCAPIAHSGYAENLGIVTMAVPTSP